MNDPFNHNPDTNPHWTPKYAQRIYRCDKCGTEKNLGTNHTGSVFAERCSGPCRTILYPNTARERVLPYIGAHSYVREAD